MSSLGAKARYARLGGVSGTQQVPQAQAPGNTMVPTVQDATTARVAAVVDNNTIIEFTNASAITYTIKANASVPLPVGSILYAKQGGDGQVTFVADAGVTFDDTSDSYSTRTKTAYIAMKHTAMDRWSPIGDLEWLLSAVSVVGNPGTADAPPIPIVATADGQQLRRRGGELFWDGSYAIATGTANALAAAITSNGAYALTDGVLIGVRAIAANTTTTPTLSVNGGTARTIVKNGGNALVVGDIKGAGHELLLRYNLTLTQWELINPAVSGGGSSTVISDTAPASPIAGMSWINSATGRQYAYYDDGSSQQWVEFGPDMPSVLFSPNPSEGTVFPASPADGDRFYRSDLHLECFWNATAGVWLTTSLMVLNTSWVGAALAVNTRAAEVTPRDDMYIETVSFSARVNSGTNNGSNYWRLTLYKTTPAEVSTAIGGTTTAAVAAGVSKIAQVVIGAVVGAGYSNLNLWCAKTGAPSNLATAHMAIYYRLVVT